MTERVYECPPLASGKPAAASTCVKAFTAAMGAEVVKTVTDGNCFFDALLLSQTLTLPPSIRGAAAQRQYLRDYLVDYLLDHVDPAIIPAKNIEELYESGAYACSAGDLVPEYAPLAFGIRLNLYDLHADPSGHYAVLLHRYGREGPVVNVLRTGEHYQFLHTVNRINEMRAMAEAKALANAVKKAQQEDANAALAKQMAQWNFDAIMAKKAQENANAALAASLQGGVRRTSRPKTRRRVDGTIPKHRRRSIRTPYW